MEILRAEHVSYSYQSKYQKVEAVKDVSCVFEKGKFYAIVGESGSGKSTFLSLLAGLDQPCEGTIYVEGEPLSDMDRDAYRLNRAAVVYQAFHLFPLLTAQENVMLPLEFKKMHKKEAVRQAQRLLQRVGLESRIYRQFPKMMSGGEQIILADEPTGNLDSGNEENVVALLKELAHEDGYTVIVITHNQRVADETDHVFRMKDGSMEQVR